MESSDMAKRTRRPKATAEQDWFWEHVDRSGACWLWTRPVGDEGYGRFQLEGRDQYVHRIAYEMLVGPIPPGFDLDHVCHNVDLECPGGPTCLHRRCVNPAHLEAVTTEVNNYRAVVHRLLRDDLPVPPPMRRRVPRREPDPTAGWVQDDLGQWHPAGWRPSPA